GAISSAEATIDAIEARTAAGIVVYTQDSGTYDLTTDATRAKAAALIDQWGVGRAGFDDGLAIFFDLDPTLRHGQVQLYAGPGFEAAYLSNEERQAIFDSDMLPYLRSADFDGALAIALRKIDGAATPEHAASLQTARQVNAVVGLVGAPIVLLALVGWAFFHWRRFGKDPVYLDDPSILMPAPPPELTAAAGAMVMDGGTSRRALTTAVLDLASRGLIAFRQEESGLLGRHKKVGIDVAPARGNADAEAQQARNARRPIGPAEELALRDLRSIGGTSEGSYIEPDDVVKFGEKVAAFDRALESHVVGRGWFAQRPSKVVLAWVARGVVAIVIASVALVAGLSIPMSGLTLIGAAGIVGGVVVLLFARSMPAVTMSGAMIRAMLAAYRRTLQKTMAQARSMDQVVSESGLAWLETPDQAIVWGTALGLQSEIEVVLNRSLEDVRSGQTGGVVPWFPVWYQGSGGHSLAGATAAGSGAGLFSNSGIPDIGGMMSSLGSIGNSPASSGGGGGFSGGGSGGGGGGAGGGF
ncbi:MAG: DUF2207 domain-containing protein, partial [Chloroflexi bacterium]|nr:DUF2207 domain-containing protein [Chloroflexota bacterium]